MSIGLGDTYIITNAATGWIEYTSKKYFKGVYELLPKLKVMSARAEYEGVFPRNVQQWKIHAFLRAKQNLDSDLLTNIIAVSDANADLAAAQNLASYYLK